MISIFDSNDLRIFAPFGMFQDWRTDWTTPGGWEFFVARCRHPYGLEHWKAHPWDTWVDHSKQCALLRDKVEGFCSFASTKIVLIYVTIWLWLT
jgi:hypothetical protein